MDILTHGLWGGLIFGKDKKFFKYALLFGILPDLIPFAPYTIFQLISGALVIGKPELRSFPDWVFVLYNTTHSLIVVTTIWIIIRKFLGKEYSIAFLAWPLHILMDIPTHTADFFPTKILYPLSHLHYDGVSWSHPIIMIVNYSLLFLAYGLYIYNRNKKKHKKTII